MNFLCSVEYDPKDVGSQIRALDRLKALAEYMAGVKEEGEGEWKLPVGWRETAKFHQAPDKSYHLHVRTTSIMESSLSVPEGPGGFSFDLRAGLLKLGYAARDKPTISLLVSYRYRCRKEATGG